MDLFEHMANEYLNSCLKALEKYATTVVNKTYQVLFEDILDCVNSSIKNFYSDYTPMVYTRHGDLSGFNLYNSIKAGGQIKLDMRGDLIAGINFTPNTEFMLPYYSNFLSDEDILNNIVFNGIHGNIEKVGIITKSTIQGKYFKVSGTTNEILKQIQEQFDEASKKAYKDLLSEDF